MRRLRVRVRGRGRGRSCRGSGPRRPGRGCRWRCRCRCRWRRGVAVGGAAGEGGVNRSRWTMVWWRSQSRTPLARSVGPPSSQCRRWWASHQVAGVVQRGKVQCRSRSQRAFVWAVVKYRWSRPQCRMCPSGARTTGITVPSQASRRTVSGPRRVPASTPPTRTPGRVRCFRSSRPMVTSTVALVRGRCDGRRGGRDGAAADLDEGVAAALVDGAGVDFAVGGLGCGQDVDGGFDDGSGLGVEPHPVLGDPAADVVPTRQDGQPPVPVLQLLQPLAEAVPGQHGRPDPADPGGAVDLAHGDQAGGDRVDRARLQQRGQLPQLGRDHAAGGHRQPTLLHRHPSTRQPRRERRRLTWA